MRADELYLRAKKKEPHISLSTIYRNLKLFKELGLISESSLGDTHSHYEIKGSAEHYHLRCLGCGDVIEFESPLIAKAITKAQRKEGFEIISVQMNVEGYCSKCKDKRD